MPPRSPRRSPSSSPTKVEIILILGASAIVDREDVVPAAIARSGGEILHFGMPVDPGNLLLLAQIGKTPVIGVPGCARSPKASGFDWVLERLAANLPVTRADIMKMGVGGLLAEVFTRPCLRLPSESGGADEGRDGSESRALPSGAVDSGIAAVVLAAGLSRRMEGVNKLTAEVAGEPIIARVVDALLASKASPVIVVVGHEEKEVRAALTGRDVRFVTNPEYEEGLGASLRDWNRVGPVRIAMVPSWRLATCLGFARPHVECADRRVRSRG